MLMVQSPAESVPLKTDSGPRPATSGAPAEEPAEGELLTDAEMREREKANLLVALRMADWRISGEGGAADLLGLKPSTLAYRMRAFGIERV